MGSRVSPNIKCWHLRTPYSLCHSHKSPRTVASLPPRNVTYSNNHMPCRLVYRFALCGSRSLRMHRVKRSSSAHFDDFHHEEVMDLIQKVEKKLDANAREIAHAVFDRGSSEQFWTVKPEFLEPSLLGIHPKRPSWPERDEIIRLSFERKLNSVEIPFSIRMIKKKLHWEKGLKEASELTYCSVKKTFSSMLFIIHVLQNYALQTRENLYYEDLQGVMAKLQRELDASFVWLFQKVFWKTPCLMVYVMVLLAKFCVFSMSNNIVMAVTPSMVAKVLPLTDDKNKQQHLQGDQDEYRKKELTEMEEMLWNSMLEEASRWQKEIGTEALDNETMLRFVAPVSVQLEGDQYEEYVKTRLSYRRHLREAPYNSLLLSNYAQFLYLVVHDLDGGVLQAIGSGGATRC